MKMSALLLTVLLLLATIPAAALDTSDPLDEVYTWLRLWHEGGLIERLPYLEPYPVQLVESLLREVARRGGPDARSRAEAYLGEISPTPEVDLLGLSINHATQEDFYGITGLYLATTSHLTDRLTMSGAGGGVVVVEPGEWEVPLIPGQRPSRDYYVDWSDVTVKGIHLLPTLSIAGSAAFGTDTLWVQTGVNRSSFGPFDEGPVLSPQASQAGHFSLTWRGRRVIYSEFLLALTATSDRGVAIEDDGGVDTFPNKYLAGQSLQVFPLPWLELSFFETVVFGERLELLYLVPFFPRNYTSIIVGAMDNMMLGFGGTVHLPADLNVDLMFYADDLHFLDMLALNLDTKYKVSAQAGLSWTPLMPILKRVSADYALVTPFTYTHRVESLTDQESTIYAPPLPNDAHINYVNYTHAGRSLVSMEPNSDRLRLRAVLTPLERVDVTLALAYRRHADASPPSAYAAAPPWSVGTEDGGINDNGYIAGGDHLFENVDFLNQDVIEKIFLLGFQAGYRMPLGPGRLRLTGGYTLEIARNKRGSDPNNTAPIDGNDETVHHVTLGIEYAY